MFFIMKLPCNVYHVCIKLEAKGFTYLLGKQSGTNTGTEFGQ